MAASEALGVQGESTPTTADSTAAPETAAVPAAGVARAEIGRLRAEVSANGQRLARIEGFLGIGTPEALPESSPP